MLRGVRLYGLSPRAWRQMSSGERAPSSAGDTTVTEKTELTAQGRRR